MYKFDTKVQHLKYKVLRTVAKHAWEGDFYSACLDIPKEIIPGKVPTMRCCVYKERAILAERVKMAAGGDKNNPNVIEAIDIACDDCPTGGQLRPVREGLPLRRYPQQKAPLPERLQDRRHIHE